jgi:hypothetical protein
MIPEAYRPYETGTLMDLVSYGDPDQGEPATEEWSSGEGEATRRWRVLGRRSRSWMRSRTRKWPRLAWRRIARSGNA